VDCVSKLCWKVHTFVIVVSRYSSFLSLLSLNHKEGMIYTNSTVIIIQIKYLMSFSKIFFGYSYCGFNSIRSCMCYCVLTKTRLSKTGQKETQQFQNITIPTFFVALFQSKSSIYLLKYTYLNHME
jgi:hypothetical protein